MFESVGQLIFAFRELWVECLGSRAAENVACSMRCANRKGLEETYAKSGDFLYNEQRLLDQGPDVKNGPPRGP